ncbi:MAG: hypothetical protein HYT93_00925 [Parcubacteria group bacterium]|nr:hypothetical protein [Parcubacteria group bacterium]
MLQIALLAVCFAVLSPIVEASIIGLYYYVQNDKVSVVLKDGRPFLIVEVSKFPDLPACTGFQVYRTKPFTRKELNLISGPQGKGTGFGLWKSKKCLDAYYEKTGKNERVPVKKLVQEIDVYNDFFGYFTNKEQLIRDFEAGNFFLAVMYQKNYDGYESDMYEELYSYKDVVNGKVLLGQ